MLPVRGLRRARAGTLRPARGMLHPITRHPVPCLLPLLRPDSLFAISIGVVCGRAQRQTSALKRKSRSRTEPELGEPSWDSKSPGSQSQGSQSWDSRAGTVAAASARAGARHSRAMSRLLPFLLLVALGCAAKLKPRPVVWDDRADAQKVPVKGCANLTLVLDNWKFAITSQMRNLLLFDHQTVLPDYGRIRSLSGALDELYRDFSALKEQLGRLSARFAEAEALVDQLRRGRGPGAPPQRRGLPQPARRPPDPPQQPHRAPARGGTARWASA
ncbi:uncharacterized protein LOC129783766 isoform X1 [Falco peregrinus]|uniref:uncharacterized protein LOC129783766 isoform X1 n=1 Tax=Falco peregrinus TaxID=8954 RepID=UPI00247ABDBE|nr:uncharacterized protein LOC129783766 isoform X1 [Falco peregrinus]